MTTSSSIPDLSALRRFVTLVDLHDLARHIEEAAGYFDTFSDADDATLLISAATPDVAWAEAVVLDLIAAAGSRPDACADVMLVVVDEDEHEIWVRLARRAHAVLGHGPADWVMVRRPTYGWGQLPALRDYAARCWGARLAPAPYSYEDAIAHVVARGWATEDHARMGSVPEASMASVVATLEAVPAVEPRLLHVGNFVGISLSYLLDWARARNGFTVSVDPDIPHRGVEHPQRAVCDLLAHFGLSERHLLVCGYSLSKCFSNDGVVFEGYDPAAGWSAEAAPENVLPGLAASGQRFDAAFIDGNHDAGYLRRELIQITGLLKPGGLLVLDDVDENWDQISRLFDEVGDGDWPYARVLADGRVGILRRLDEVNSRTWTKSR